MTAVLALGLLSPSEAQAGHRRYSSRNHCNSGGAVVHGLLHLAASSYYRPHYNSYYGDYAPRCNSYYGGYYPRASYHYPQVSYNYYPRISYGYSSYRCAPRYHHYRSYPSRSYYSGGYRCRR